MFNLNVIGIDYVQFKNDACSMFWPICLRYGNQENNQRLMFLKNGGGGV